LLLVVRVLVVQKVLFDLPLFGQVTPHVVSQFGV